MSFVAVVLLQSAPGLCSTEDYTDKAQDIQEELAAKKAAHNALLQKSMTLNSQVSDLKKKPHQDFQGFADERRQPFHCRSASS